MATLFTRQSSLILPPATGLMVWARREDQISYLLAGLSNQDPAIREQAVRAALLSYFQRHNGLSLQDASDALDKVPSLAVSHLTSRLLSLANQYNWE